MLTFSAHPCDGHVVANPHVGGQSTRAKADLQRPRDSDCIPSLDFKFLLCLNKEGPGDASFVSASTDTRTYECRGSVTVWRPPWHPSRSTLAFSGDHCICVKVREYFDGPGPSGRLSGLYFRHAPLFKAPISDARQAPLHAFSTNIAGVLL